jgi:hypothetical protein
MKWKIKKISLMVLSAFRKSTQFTKNFLSKLAIPKANPSTILNGLPIATA